MRQRHDKELLKAMSVFGIGIGVLSFFAAVECIITGEARIPGSSRIGRAMHGEARATVEGDVLFYWIIALSYSSLAIILTVLGGLALKLAIKGRK